MKDSRVNTLVKTSSLLIRHDVWVRSCINIIVNIILARTSSVISILQCTLDIILVTADIILFARVIEYYLSLYLEKKLLFTS